MLLKTESLRGLFGGQPGFRRAEDDKKGTQIIQHCPKANGKTPPAPREKFFFMLFFQLFLKLARIDNFCCREFEHLAAAR